MYLHYTYTQNFYTKPTRSFHKDTILLYINVTLAPSHAENSKCQHVLELFNSWQTLYCTINIPYPT